MGRWLFAPDYPRLRSYQLVADALSQALLRGAMPAGIEEQPAMQELREYVAQSDSCIALNEREAELVKRCRIDTPPNGRQVLFWKCDLKFATSCHEHLSQAAKEILSAVQPAVATNRFPHSRTCLAQLRAAPSCFFTPEHVWLYVLNWSAVRSRSLHTGRDFLD